MDVRYYVGGSIASSIHGVVRATADVDFVADLRAGQGRMLAESLAEEFYLSDAAAEDAIRHGRSFNAIHLHSCLKLDVFVPIGDVLSESAMGRASTEPGGLRIASAEDVLLAKLRWSRQHGATSERQWGDVLGILRVGVGRLDVTYCRRMAEAIGVAPMLEQALVEA